MVYLTSKTVIFSRTFYVDLILLRFYNYFTMIEGNFVICPSEITFGNSKLTNKTDRNSRNLFSMVWDNFIYTKGYYFESKNIHSNTSILKKNNFIEILRVTKIYPPPGFSEFSGSKKVFTLSNSPPSNGLQK